MSTFPVMLLAFEGISRPISLIDCEGFVEYISAALRGWRFKEVASSFAQQPAITVRKDPKGYLIDSRFRESPNRQRDPVNATCEFFVDLIKAYVADDPSLLCLHGAAAEFAGKLVVFPAKHKAGKSTLSAHLSAAGVRLYADDVLPIKRESGHGMALGILPRLRLPLPDSASTALHDFVWRRKGLRNRRWIHLNLYQSELASHGEEAPIAGIVLLDRIDTAQPKLLPAKKGEVLKRVVLQNFARDVDAVEILKTLDNLVDGARCFKLRYADSEQAAAILAKSFRRSRSRLTSRRHARAGRPGLPKSEIPDDPNGPRFRRNPNVTYTVKGHEVILADPKSQGIYHLNPVGAGLWQLLEHPVSVGKAAAVLSAAFPDVPRSQIVRDVTTLMDELLAQGLVVGAS